MDLFLKLRDAMRSGGSEGNVLTQLRTADILAISDPVPPKGENSEFELEALFGLIDRRYRRLKPTHLTINVADRNEANARMAPQIIDRLAHNALSIHCNWPSYRKPLPRLRIAPETGTESA
jgi:DNA replication protein DnaC